MNEERFRMEDTNRVEGHGPSEGFAMRRENLKAGRDPSAKASHEPTEGFSMHHEDIKPVSPAACVPPSVGRISISPVKDPYHAGDSIDLSAVGVSGTGPMEYQWYVSGLQRGSSSTLSGYTLIDFDVLDPDGSGLGHAVIQLILIGQCGTATAELTINVQK